LEKNLAGKIVKKNSGFFEVKKFLAIFSEIFQLVAKILRNLLFDFH